VGVGGEGGGLGVGGVTEWGGGVGWGGGEGRGGGVGCGGLGVGCGWGGSSYPKLAIAAAKKCYFISSEDILDVNSKTPLGERIIRRVWPWNKVVGEVLLFARGHR